MEKVALLHRAHLLVHMSFFIWNSPSTTPPSYPRSSLPLPPTSALLKCLSWFPSWTPTDNLGDLHVFNVTAREWLNISAKGDLPTARNSMGLATVGDQLYLFGGKINDTGLIPMPPFF
jgi:hypothetical protein